MVSSTSDPSGRGYIQGTMAMRAFRWHYGGWDKKILDGVQRGELVVSDGAVLLSTMLQGPPRDSTLPRPGLSYITNV